MSKCCICGSPHTRIRIAGDGDYCLACNNTRMLEKMGMEDSYHYQETIYILDDEKELHMFHLEHMVQGASVYWTAWEDGAHRTVNMITNVAEPAIHGIKMFYRKITDAVSSRTIEKRISEYPISNLLERNDRYYSLKTKGNIQILSEDGKVSFEIDGEIFTPEEVAKMFGPYPGFRLQYQIFDASDDILRKDEVLIADPVGRDVLMDELELTISEHSDDDMHIGKLDALEFAISYSSIERKLRSMVRFGDEAMREEARQTSEEIIEKLKELSFESDILKAELIDRTRRAYDPFWGVKNDRTGGGNNENGKEIH